MENKEEPLEVLLDLAERGDVAAMRGFYELALETDVFIPLLPGLIQGGEGEDLLTEERLMIVEHADKKIVPIFTKREYVSEWGADQENTAFKRIKALMRIVGDEIWLYLNPGQEVGKEFSPWELEKLREGGAHAVSDIVAELSAEFSVELEVDHGTEQFPSLKKKLVTLLEIYPEIQEAFLISFKQDEGDPSTPLFGMRHLGLSEEREKTIVDEISIMAKHDKETKMPIEIVVDLDDASSPNSGVFEGAMPFYIKQIIVE
jgi:hypothetical protein